MRNTFITLFVLALPRAVLACPVCFGQNDSPMAKAANLSIIAMLVVVAGVLIGFASFFIHLVRRARLASDEASGPVEAGRHGVSGPAEAARHVLPGSSPQEGTASC